MNKEFIPKDLDVFISLLGEILGNSRCFNILKLIETLNADISFLNAAFLNSAELVTEGLDGKEKKTSNWVEEIASGRKKIEEEKDKEEKNKDEGLNKNKVIGNMLEYFKERFEKDE